MTDVVSQLLKINLRARSKESISRLLSDVLEGEMVHDRGTDTIGEFEGTTFMVAGVMFDVVIPTHDDAPLAKVIDKHGEGIDSSIGILTGMFGQQVEYRNGSVAFWLHERVKPLCK
jgi:hypothetical protein